MEACTRLVALFNRLSLLKTVYFTNEPKMTYIELGFSNLVGGLNLRYTLEAHGPEYKRKNPLAYLFMPFYKKCGFENCRVI